MSESDNLAAFSGLTTPEVASLIARFGYNELPSQKKHNFADSLIQVLKEPMLLMLLAVGLIYLFIGEGNW